MIYIKVICNLISFSDILVNIFFQKRETNNLIFQTIEIVKQISIFNI